MNTLYKICSMLLCVIVLSGLVHAADADSDVALICGGSGQYRERVMSVSRRGC